MAQDIETPGWPLADDLRVPRPTVDPDEVVLGPTTAENELIVLGNAARQGWRVVESDGVRHTLRWNDGAPMEVARMDFEAARAALAEPAEAPDAGWSVAAVRDRDALLVRLRRAGGKAGRRFAFRPQRTR